MPEPPKDSEKINEILTALRDLAQRMPPERESRLRVVEGFLQTGSRVGNNPQAQGRIKLLAMLSSQHRLRFHKLESERKHDQKAQAIWDGIIEKCLKDELGDATIFLNLWWHDRSRARDHIAKSPEDQ